MALAERILDAMRAVAARDYGGERVSELEHALQCGDLARTAGADEELQLACLLHDVGRYAVDQARVADRVSGGAPEAGARGHHEVGAALLAPHVAERLAWLVRAHADAKRYLCATVPGYHAALSPVSQRTLEMQGGIMSPVEVEAFARHPWAADAVRLRRWDDSAKIPGRATSALEAWAPLLRAHLGASRDVAVPAAFGSFFAGLIEHVPGGGQTATPAIDATYAGCFGCGPRHESGLRVRCFLRDGEVVSPIVVPARFAGPPATAHGGIVAAYLDEVLAAAAMAVDGRICVTGELSVRYVRPAPVERPLLGRARLLEHRDRYRAVEGSLAEFPDGPVVATASGRFFPIQR